MSQGLRRKLPACWTLLSSLFAVALLAAGCSSSSSDEKEQAATETKPVEPGSEEFPNLGTVPDQAPESTPKIEREKLLQQLAADRANAEYTDEPLNAETTQAQPALPPPASAAAPEATAGAEEAAAGAEGEAPPPESAAASLPPPEVAALPVTSGEAAAVIFFQPGSDAMTDRDRAILHDVAVLQRRQQVARMTVVGHSSKAELAESGPSALDMALARANAVAAQLMVEGVPSSVLQTATSGGGTYDESGSQGGAPNQRVEILIGQ